MKKTIIALFLLTIFLINFLAVRDPDFGWHYRCGREIFTKHQLCTKNNFSYFLPDYQAAYPGFVYDTILAFTYDYFGFIGISILGAAIMTIAALIFSRFANPVFFYLILFLSWTVFGLGLRPQVITFLFFLLTLYILQLAKNNQRWLWFFPLLLLVWVNTHIGFFIGLVILAFYVIARNPTLRRMTKQSGLSIFIFIISFLATLINPFGIKVYFELINHLTSPLSSMIAEWVEPPILFKLLIIAGTLFYFFIAFRKKTIVIFDLLLLIFFAGLAFKGIRNLPFFYTIFFFVIASDPPAPIESEPAGGERSNLTPLRLLRRFTPRNDIWLPILFSLTIFLAIIIIPQTIFFDQSWEAYCKGPTRFPCEAVSKYPALSGNVYAAYEWGGFLIWQKPNIKVFADGRMPAWKDENGRSPYQVYLEILQNQPGWNEKLRKLKTDYLLIMPNTFMDLLLRKESQTYGWQEKYRDDIAVIYKNVL